MPIVGEHEASGVTLVVESAIHGQIRMPLAGPLSIGRGISSDLVLGDASIAEAHLQLRGDPAGIVIEAVGAPIVFEEGATLMPGEKRTIRKAIAFRPGDVGMRIEFPEVDVPVVAAVAKSRRMVAPLMAAALAVAVVGTTAFAVVSRAAPPRPSPIPVASARHLETDPVRARSAILAELQARGLGAIKIETTSEGSNRANGTIAPHEVSTWHNVKHWADAAFGGTVMLIDDVVIAAKPPSLAIQSAWVGDAPYVIDGAGEKLFVGAVLADGWTIDGIEAGRVLLRRQAQRLVLRF